MTILQLCATPYNIEKPFWYFSNFDEYQEKASKSGCEEFELQFIDGDETQQAIFEALKVDQSNLSLYFETIKELVDLYDNELLAIKWLSSNYSFEYALDHYQDVNIFEGTKEDYAYELINDCYDIDKMLGNLANYFDYDSFARDLELNGDIIEIGYNVYITNALEF